MKNTSKLTKITEVKKMTKSNTKNRFEKARKDLSEALNALEDSVKQALHDHAQQSRMIGISDNDAQKNQTTIIEQSTIIEHLNKEINNLQNNLSDLGNENDFLGKESKAMISKMNNCENKQEKLIALIESDLIRIEELIKDGEE